MTNTMFIRNFLAKSIALSLCTTLAAGFSQAEETAAKRGSASALLQEITVTARKKSAAEDVQDVPLAVTAYGSDQLDAIFVKDLRDLTYTAPAVQLDSVGTFKGVQNFSFRGQGIASSIPSIDPTVGVFVDGQFMGTTYGVVLDMFEIESVELLRGPQGVLFGRNVTGGAVNMRTARPDGEFGAKVKVKATDYDHTTIAGTIEGSLIEDKLAGKLVAYYDDDDGYFDNTGTGTQVPGQAYFASPGKNEGALETGFARGTLVWQATDDLDVTLIGESGEMDGDGGVWQLTPGIVRQPSGNVISGNGVEFETAGDEKGYTDIEWSSLVIESNLKVDFGDGVITNVLAWRDLESGAAVDLDGSPAPIFGLEGVTNQDQISNELRFAGSFMDGKLDVTTGLFYFEQDVSYREARAINVIVPPTRLALGGDMDHDTKAVFASLDYHITDALTVTAGGRYTRESKDAEIIDVSNDPSCAATLAVPDFSLCSDAVSRSWSSFTPKLAIQYYVNENTQVYASWTKGFRSGGVNFRNAKPLIFPAGPTDAEEQVSYEVGVKSDMLNGRLRVNAAYFFADIEDYQREIQRPDADVIILQATVNAGDAEIQGIETDVVYLLTDNFSINAAFSLLDGEWTDLDPMFAANFGEELSRLARKTASIGATLDVNLEEMGLLTFRAGYAYRDGVFVDEANALRHPIIRDVTASIDYTAPGDKLKVSLFGKNLRDDPRWGIFSASFGSLQKGRVVGLEATYTY